MGAEDVVVKGKLTKTDDTHASIVWEDRSDDEETMRFISDKSSDDFQFYTNRRSLPDGSGLLYKGHGEEAPQAAADTDPETVSIQLYINTGDHNSNCAWYQVNRQTAKGIDANTGESIDLGILKKESQNDNR